MSKKDSTNYFVSISVTAEYIKAIEENDTVGIIICKKNNQYVIDYCSDKRILSREYELI